MYLNYWYFRISEKKKKLKKIFIINPLIVECVLPISIHLKQSYRSQVIATQTDKLYVKWSSWKKSFFIFLLFFGQLVHPAYPNQKDMPVD